MCLTVLDWILWRLSEDPVHHSQHFLRSSFSFSLPLCLLEATVSPGSGYVTFHSPHVLLLLFLTPPSFCPYFFFSCKSPQTSPGSPRNWRRYSGWYWVPVSGLGGKSILTWLVLTRGYLANWRWVPPCEYLSQVMERRCGMHKELCACTGLGGGSMWMYFSISFPLNRHEAGWNNREPNVVPIWARLGGLKGPQFLRRQGRGKGGMCWECFQLDRSKMGRRVSVPLGVKVSRLQVMASFRSELNSQHHLDAL